MSITSRKAPTTFGGLKNAGGKSKLTPGEWAALMLAAGFPPDPRVIGEGLGVLNAESGFRVNPGGDGAHFGAWQEDSSFGSEADRLNPVKATQGAFNRWKSDGETFQSAWGKWESQQAGHNGAADWAQYKAVAEAAIGSGIGGIPRGGGINPLEPIEGAIGTVEDAGDFLTKLGELLFDWKSLGNLAAHAFAWFIKLLAKAIWDYVIAPMIHWTERAVSFYWVNFFGTGTERGSGFGYQLRNNAGGITVLFWSIGYAVLWSDGQSLTPTGAHESLLGQSVKSIDGLIARRKLIKPKQVKEKTPAKPEPTESKVPIQRKQTFSVMRKRPVSVHTEGRQRVSSKRQGFQPRPAPVPRPQRKKEGEAERIGEPLREQQQTKAKAQKPPKQSRSRVGA